MMIVPAGVKVHLALGHTDMRKGMDGLAMPPVQDTPKKDALSGHLFAFRGKMAVKLLPEATVSAPRIESRHGWSRCRPLRHGARRGDSGGSSLARRDASRPSEPFVEF